MVPRVHSASRHDRMRNQCIGAMTLLRGSTALHCSRYNHCDYEGENMGDPIKQIPMAFRERFAELVGLTDAFCESHLNDEYKTVCREMVAAVCQRGSPVLRGKATGWASGIVFSVGWINFLGDPDQSLRMTGKQIAQGFGVSEATLMARSREIRKGLDIIRFDPMWTIPSRLDDNPLLWMIEVDGLIVDVRHAPYEFQKTAYEAGLIPYIPADETDGNGTSVVEKDEVAGDRGIVGRIGF